MLEIPAQYARILIWITFASYIYMVIKIGFRNFTACDVYKIFFPFYLYIYFEKFKKTVFVIIPIIHVISIIIVALYFYNGQGA